MRRARVAARASKGLLVLAHVAGGAGIIEEESALHAVGRPERPRVPRAANALQQARVVGRVRIEFLDVCWLCFCKDIESGDR